MQRKVLAVTLSAALCMPALAFAQAKADFSGTWTFDEAKSDPAGGPGGGGGGGGRPGGGGRMGGGTPSKLVIKQTASDLTVETTTASGAQTAVYKLDGSESVNKTAMGESKAKATWEGSTLVIAGKQALSTPQGNFEIDVKDVYSLADGVLTVTATRVTPRGETTRKLVFNKG
jgi:hypothetical protein